MQLFWVPLKKILIGIRSDQSVLMVEENICYNSPASSGNAQVLSYFWYIFSFGSRLYKKQKTKQNKTTKAKQKNYALKLRFSLLYCALLCSIKISRTNEKGKDTWSKIKAFFCWERTSNLVLVIVDTWVYTVLFPRDLWKQGQWDPHLEKVLLWISRKLTSYSASFLPHLSEDAVSMTAHGPPAQGGGRSSLGQLEPARQRRAQSQPWGWKLEGCQHSEFWHSTFLHS